MTSITHISPIGPIKQRPNSHLDSMFTQQDLRREFPIRLASAPLAIEAFTFAKADFTPEIGHYLWLFEGKKKEVGTALAFWIEATIAMRDVPGPFNSGLNGCQCEPLNRKEFEELASRCQGALKEPLPKAFINLDGFCWGMRMHNEWSEHSAMAELSDSFIAFFGTVRTSNDFVFPFAFDDELPPYLH